YLLFSVPAAELVAGLFARRRRAALGLLFLLTASGLLELMYVQKIRPLSILDRTEVGLAERIRAETDPLARFATAPVHNHPVMVLGARPILVGYPGWVNNFGFEFEPALEDLKRLY